MLRYVSIDIETTGLETDKDFILEFAAIADDSEGAVEDLASFTRVIKWERISGNPFALSMNSAIITESLGKSAITPDRLIPEFIEWLRLIGYEEDHKLVLAGKNVAGFDNLFLKHFPGWGSLVKYYHRMLDPNALWTNPREDKVPPDLATCLKRAGLNDFVTHRALGDATAVVHVLRAGWARIYDRPVGYVNML